MSLPETGSVNLSVFNVMGQRVAVLLDGRVEAGVHTVTWDATNFATGMYFYRLTTDQSVETKKMLLVK